MLVLSRGQNDKVLFPNLGISVDILRIAGNRVKLGIVAPDDVKVLRGELEDGFGQAGASGRGAASEERHRMRNELNTASLMLRLAEKQLNAGLTDDALETLGRSIRQFDTIDQSQTRAANKPEPRSEKPSALVVDDDSNESELLAGYLRLSGFDVNTATDGLQAMVQLSRLDRPDLVLMDMNMPRMSGARTVESIRRNPQFEGLKIFAVTGEDAGAGGVPIGDRGVDRWFTKPIKPEQLVTEMTRAIRRP